MFDVYCPKHGARVLIWPSGLDGIRNRPDGMEVAYHCTCGYRGVWRPRRRAAKGSRDRAVL